MTKAATLVIWLLKVDDIYAACQKLQNGGVVINRPPRDGRMAFVRSPDNISIELLQKVMHWRQKNHGHQWKTLVTGKEYPKYEIHYSNGIYRQESLDAQDITNVEGASVRLHWTDEPYIWHTNDGREVFVVLSGQVDMLYRDDNGTEHRQEMQTGDICFADDGDEHVAHPKGPAHNLVIEKAGSI